jgi:hypothetical protein
MHSHVVIFFFRSEEKKKDIALRFFFFPLFSPFERATNSAEEENGTKPRNKKKLLAKVQQARNPNNSPSFLLRYLLY